MTLRTGITILIVDDELQVVESLKRTLRHEHYEVLIYTSPLEAMARLEEGGIDILLSDIDMPEMTGLELIREARARHPAVARILLTGDSSIESAVAAINQGSVHKYLTKPWQAAELRETLRSVVATLEIVRRDALSLQIAMRAEEQQAEFEARFRGFTSVRRVDGAYLLHEVRTIETLSGLGQSERSRFRAASWLPDGDDRTEDLRKP